MGWIFYLFIFMYQLTDAYSHSQRGVLISHQSICFEFVRNDNSTEICTKALFDANTHSCETIRKNMDIEMVQASNMDYLLNKLSEIGPYHSKPINLQISNYNQEKDWSPKLTNTKSLRGESESEESSDINSLALIVDQNENGIEISENSDLKFFTENYSFKYLFFLLDANDFITKDAPIIPSTNESTFPNLTAVYLKKKSSFDDISSTYTFYSDANISCSILEFTEQQAIIHISILSILAWFTLSTMILVSLIYNSRLRSYYSGRFYKLVFYISLLKMLYDSIAIYIESSCCSTIREAANDLNAVILLLIAHALYISSVCFAFFVINNYLLRSESITEIKTIFKTLWIILTYFLFTFSHVYLELITIISVWYILTGLICCCFHLRIISSLHVSIQLARISEYTHLADSMQWQKTLIFRSLTYISIFTFLESILTLLMKFKPDFFILFYLLDSIAHFSIFLSLTILLRPQIHIEQNLTQIARITSKILPMFTINDNGNFEAKSCNSIFSLKRLDFRSQPPVVILRNGKSTILV